VFPIKIEDEILGVISADRIYTSQEGDVDDDLRVLSIVASLICPISETNGKLIKYGR